MQDWQGFASGKIMVSDLVCDPPPSAAEVKRTMAKPPDRPRGPIDPRRAAAEAVFRPKAPERVRETPSLPNAKELVSLRIDRDILDHFREDGPGWQDRINDALRKLIEP